MKLATLISSSITVWYGSADQHSKSKLQRIINKAAKIIGHDLPTLDSIYTSRTITRATKIIKDPSHPAHSLFQPLPSGKRYRSISTSTSRFKNSFYPTAIRTLNSLSTPLPLPPSHLRSWKSAGLVKLTYWFYVTCLWCCGVFMYCFFVFLWNQSSQISCIENKYHQLGCVAIKVSCILYLVFHKYRCNTRFCGYL